MPPKAAPAEQFPYLARARLVTDQIMLAIELERAALESPVDRPALFEHLDTVAFMQFETDRQCADWSTWPARIAAELAGEMGIPEMAKALEVALARRVLERLRTELLMDVKD